MIQCQTVDKVIDEIRPFIPQHYREVGYPEKEPDWDQYKKLGQSGIYWMVTKRIDGKIIGYVGFLVYRHLHFSEKTAEIDTVYVLPEHRGFTAYRLLKEALNNIKEMNVTRVRALEKNKGLIRILERLGFEKTEGTLMEMVNG
jgi:N-acetylglutamate synthase-like GNAT family acetyltransferase